MERRTTHHKKNSNQKDDKKAEHLDPSAHGHSHKRRSSNQHKSKSKSIRSRDYTKNKKSSSGKDVKHSDIIFMIGKFFADDFWETAWDICETRFARQNASKSITSDLRDTWLSIIGMQWMDTDPVFQDGIELPNLTINDCPPLPPKFDFWSHGALELLPRTCRESVMDPFMRDPLPWFLGEFQENLGSDMPTSNATFVLSGKSTAQLADSKKEIIDSHVTEMIRPTSPVPSEEEYAESTWSLASTGGSFSNLDLDKNDLDSTHIMLSYPTSADSLNATFRKEGSIGKSSSIEFLYPPHMPAADIRASSELSYNWGYSGPSGVKRNGSNTKTGSQLIAFKLPHQTSSESKKAHEQRKLLPNKSTSTASYNQQDE